MALKQNNAGILREMRQILHLAAEPHSPHDNVAAAIGRAAVALGLGYRRAYSLWYGADRTLVRPEEAARLRAERDRLLERRLARLHHDIAVTERLLEDARRRHAQGTAVVEGAADLAGAAAEPDGEVDYTALIGCAS